MYILFILQIILQEHRENIKNSPREKVNREELSKKNILSEEDYKPQDLAVDLTRLHYLPIHLLAQKDDQLPVSVILFMTLGACMSERETNHTNIP